ncbi:MAG: iron-containing alcohol dehydrogenase [Bryobacterales bacterium]|nr:iron-containing alcohol dehydrogenase [Bryobacterales bacterium]
MTPFDFQPRTRVVFGAGSLERLGELAKGLGGRRALLVSDPGIVAAGYTNRALRLLMQADIETHLFSDVEENPSTAHVDAGLLVARAKEVDLIVGLGGGSSMDCAKGVNFVYTNGGTMHDYWGVGKAHRPLLPFIAIPTTAGTGSEAQSFALISDTASHRKMACGDPKAAAAVAILDPELTASQPRDVTANTGIDALTHALETWVSRKRNPLSEAYSREAWRLIARNFRKVIDSPNDVEARAGMQLGAHFAGAAIECSMLGAAHSCANPLTAHYGIVHGSAVGLMLPSVIRFNAEAVGGLYDELGGAEELAATVEGLLAHAGLPTRLEQHGVLREDLPQLAAEAAGQWTAQFNPREVDAAALEEIYRCAW